MIFARSFAFLFAGALLAADDSTRLAVVRKLFDAVANKETSIARALFTPDAMLYSAKPDGTAGGVTAVAWLERAGNSKEQWLERVWNPKQMESGTVAHVWADYDFHLAGKFSHCGIDSFSLLKTAGGWKITSISDTRQKDGCAPSPLGRFPLTNVG